MKIAYLANIRFPSERAHAAQIAHMCQALVEKGAEVDLIVNERVVCDKKEIDTYFGFPIKFTVSRLPISWIFPKSKVGYYFGELCFAILFILKKRHHKYDVILSRSDWLLYFLSFFFDTKKLLWESHEARLVFPARKILKKGVKTVVISEGIYEDYLEYGISKKQMMIAHDGIEKSFFVNADKRDIVRDKLGLSKEDKIVMYIGGFDEWKGIRTFCSAAELCPKVKFVAIGGREEQVMSFSRQYPLVTFLGALPYKDLKHNQQAADILVVPNTAKTKLSSRYTSPLKLFAHMASGIPLLVSDVKSIVTVTGNELVTVFKADNHRSLADGVKAILSEPKTYKDRARQLKEVSKQYLWTNRAEQILKFIDCHRL